MLSSRRLRWLLYACVLYTAFCLIGGVYLADETLHPGRRPLTDVEVNVFRQTLRALNSEFDDVSITAPDGATLRGWILRPDHPNGDAAILLHGLADNRLGMEGYAKILLARGFVVLLPDARAHGTSGGALATYGLLEREDVHQWLNLLVSQVRPKCIYGVGESMGAAELLQSLDGLTPFCAVIAESSFASFREIAYDRMGQPFHTGPWLGHTILRPLVEIAFLRARLKYHLDMQQVSPQDFVARTHVPVLLIHGEIDSNIPDRHSRLIHDKNPNSVLWEVAGADHCGAISTAPQEFEKRLVTWFARDPQTAAATPDNTSSR
jgi:alpha-beta hydrolase superfamily lysophospholipase